MISNESEGSDRRQRPVARVGFLNQEISASMRVTPSMLEHIRLRVGKVSEFTLLNN